MKSIYCYHCGSQAAKDDLGRYACSEHGVLWHLHRNAPCADALVLHDDQVLLIKRGREPFKGMWAMPGGFQEFGEHPSTTVTREVQEETGVTIELTGILGIYAQKISAKEFRQVTVFVGQPTSQNSPRAGDDAADCRWFPIDELPDTLVPFHHQRFVDYKNNEPPYVTRVLHS